MRLLTKLPGRAIIAVCSLVLLAGCDESIDSAPPIKSITATSYNLGLALNFVPYTNERLVVLESLIAEYENRSGFTGSGRELRSTLICFKSPLRLFD